MSKAAAQGPTLTRHELRIDVAAGRVEKRRVGPGGFGALATEAEALDRLAGLSCVPRRLAWDGERLVTALVPGLPLARFWTGAALSARQRLALRLVQAVEQLHARGVAHRDLTPQNVLVTPDGAPVLLDFELARMPGHAHEGGAIGVAAPELRWLPHPALFDRRVDLYALGILLRRLLGFRFSRGEIRWSHEAGERFVTEVRSLTGRTWSVSMEERRVRIIHEFAPIKVSPIGIISSSVRCRSIRT